MDDPELIKKLIERNEKQKERIRKYYSEHREEQNARSRAYFQKLKEDPEKYKKYLDKKKEIYKKKNPKPVLPVKEFE